jgi:hypothetical protein
MPLIVFAELVVDVVDRVDLTIEENVVLEVLNSSLSVRPTEMQADITLFLDVFVLRVVLRFTETLHDSFEATPVPVCSGNNLLSNTLGYSFG